MLLLTGQRRTECAGLKWSELDLQHKVWVLPADRSKNRTEHMVPLSEATLDLLKAVPRAPGVDYVFAFDKLPVNDFAGAKRQLDDALLLDLPQWQFHDLRRSFASELARLRVPPHVIEACLNHRSGIVSGISKTYNRYSYLDEKIVAMNAWARELDAIVHGRAETNVVSLR
jgi:integrase